MLPVKRSGRMLDVASLVLLLGGAVCYVWAYLGMQALRDSTHDAAAPLFAGYTRYVRLSQVSILGLTAIALGILVGIYAAMHARRE